MKEENKGVIHAMHDEETGICEASDSLPIVTLLFQTDREKEWFEEYLRSSEYAESFVAFMKRKGIMDDEAFREILP